jgi:hypothetical protein
MRYRVSGLCPMPPSNASNSWEDERRLDTFQPVNWPQSISLLIEVIFAFAASPPHELKSRCPLDSQAS